MNYLKELEVETTKGTERVYKLETTLTLTKFPFGLKSTFESLWKFFTAWSSHTQLFFIRREKKCVKPIESQQHYQLFPPAWKNQQIKSL